MSVHSSQAIWLFPLIILLIALQRATGKAPNGSRRARLSARAYRTFRIWRSRGDIIRSFVMRFVQDLEGRIEGRDMGYLVEGRCSRDSCLDLHVGFIRYLRDNKNKARLSL